MDFELTKEQLEIQRAAREFAKGEFDQTDLIFGSGIRCRDRFCAELKELIS